MLEKIDLESNVIEEEADNIGEDIEINTQIAVSSPMVSLPSLSTPKF